VPRALSIVAILVAAASRLPAQTANDLLQQGVRAYQRLEYEAAVALLRESLVRREPAALADSQRARALSYLAATELFQQQRDSATAAFRTLVRLDPRYRPDELIFPPQVTNLYEEVRRSTKVLSVQVPPVTELHARLEWFTARLVTTSVQSVTATLARDDGTPVRTLYDGPVADSLSVKWDGLTAAGTLPEEGRYVLQVAPRPPLQDGPRPLQVALDITHVAPDTLAWPPPPATPALLPERTSATPALGSLAAGTFAGGAVVALPALFGRGGEATGARFAVAAAVSIAGLVGFFAHQPRPIEANIKANAPARADWQRRLDQVKGENAKRRGSARLLIRAGPVTVAERAP
jgi:tetratricopeptide (TPR) repeat protein